MVQIHDKIFIGTNQNCTFQVRDEWAIIHACKHPCHVKAVGYKGNLSKSHPNYLIMEGKKHLVLNMVDMEQELHPAFTHPIMKASMMFIETYIKTNKVLIHCNQGQSRSPSIALIYFARTGIISQNSFASAAKDFIQIYHNYKPGKGIAKYVNRHWEYLINLK